jgi:anaerobic selenocysteine-containing dehydrogenase
LPRRVLDHRFIARFTEGFGEFATALSQVSWADIVAQSGVSQELIESAAQIFIESERTIFCWAMGLTQHKNAVANIQEIVNLMLMRGQVGLKRRRSLSRSRSQQRSR